MRRLIHLATALVCLPLLYFAAAGLGAFLPGTQADLPPGTAVTIGLVRGPIHYDLLLPLTPALRAHYHFAESAGVPVSNPNAEWLLVGWGALGFYTTVGSYADLNAGSVWRGITGDDAVMHIDVTGPIRDVAGILRLPLSEPQYAALLARIDASFQRDQTNSAIALPGAGLGAHDGFFAAKGHFNLFHTCNVWIGETLRGAGVPFGMWTPTPQSVELALTWHQRA